MDTRNDSSDDVLLLLAAVIVVIVCSATDIPRAYPYRPPVGIPPGKFELDKLDDEYCRRLMRFTKDEIRTLVSALRIDEISYRTRYKPDPETALCLLLIRLSYPQRIFTLTQTFHRSEAWISTVYNDVCVHLFQEYKELVAWHPMLNNPKRLKRYAKAVLRQLDLPYTAIWGFVDGTFRGVCQPQEEQEKIYSGYKKGHGIKWQGIVTPDGLIHMQGPYEGRINDWAMYEDTHITTRIRKVCKRLFYCRFERFGSRQRFGRNV